MAEEQHSAGVIPYRTTGDNQIDVLVLQYPQGHWSFPKGHVEAGESDWETARRELREETGLGVLKRDDDFKHEFDYTFSVDSRTIHKTVAYFSASVPSGEPVELSHEHNDYQWATPDQIPGILTHDNATTMFQEWMSRET